MADRKNRQSGKYRFRKSKGLAKPWTFFDDCIEYTSLFSLGDVNSNKTEHILANNCYKLHIR